MNAPTRKTFPTLGDETADVRDKYEEDTNVKSQLEVNCDTIREKLIVEGKRYEMRLRQPNYSPILKVGDVT